MNIPNIEKNLNWILPNSLSDIIRENKNLVTLELANTQDLEILNAKISKNEPIKDLILNWRFIAWRVHIEEKNMFAVLIHLSGELEDKTPWITSAIKHYDQKTRIVETSSGSYYKLKGRAGKGEPDMHGLLHLCAALHTWGKGEMFGVPHIFY